MKNTIAMSAAALCLAACGAARAAYPVETFRTPDGTEVKITLIAHGSLCIDYAGLNIQIDPVGNGFGMKNDYSGFPKADFIFVTHEHGDHLDAKTIAALSKESTKIYLNAKSRDTLGKGTSLANGDTVALGTNGVSVTAVPAYNTTPGREKFHPKGNGNGYVFDFNGFKVYVSGDTEDIPELADLAGPDVAFLSVNQPYTMTPEQCVKAASRLRPKTLIPYHLGNTDIQAIRSGFADGATELRLFECLR